MIISLEDLNVVYDDKIVLDHVTMDLPKQKLIGIVGPNGAGKSTLLKAIMGLIPYNGGKVRVCGKPIGSVRRQVSYMPQKEAVDWDFPICVLDVALLGRYNRLKFFQRPSKLDKDIAMSCLEKVGLKDLYKEQIGKLSGGQQQRLFVARALAQDADLYFMDEPFRGIDITTERAIIDILKDMVKGGKTVVVVHHNLGSVLEYFDHLILLNKKVIASGPTRRIFNIPFLEKAYNKPLFDLCLMGKSF